MESGRKVAPVFSRVPVMLSISPDTCRDKIRGHPKRNARPDGPFRRFSRSYFGTGSAAKFAWTNIHLPSFFTNTRVVFARLGSVFPSLSMVRPT